jgi:hypothetical protein
VSDGGFLAEDTSVAAIVDAQNEGKQPCPECGVYYQALGVHRAAKHGYRGGKKRRAPRVKRDGPGPGRPPRVDMQVDDIFDVVVGQLFPKGYIPVHALTPLLRWRHATDEMLIEVTNGRRPSAP